MKPKILIIAEEGWAKNIQHFIVNLDYGKAISKAGGLPIVAISERNIDDYVSICDGVLFTDGPFVHVGAYGDYYKNKNYPELHRRREIMEFAILDKMVKLGKPVLGVNRGMKLINVYFGGTLCDDTVSQKIDKLAKCLTPTAFDDNGVSSFVHIDKMVVGISSKIDELDQSVFDSFVKGVQK